MNVLWARVICPTPSHDCATCLLVVLLTKLAPTLMSHTANDLISTRHNNDDRREKIRENQTTNMEYSCQYHFFFI